MVRDRTAAPVVTSSPDHNATPDHDTAPDRPQITGRPQIWGTAVNKDTVPHLSVVARTREVL
ncbi:hypothetical protein LK08_27355 [Streptomyces sp. MUSC 125]|nr:hypothetical protein LK08_27355 [Streptomyces sp. MUSC 125]